MYGVFLHMRSFLKQAQIMDQFNAIASAYATVTVASPDLSSPTAVAAAADKATSALTVAAAAGDANACAQLRNAHIFIGNSVRCTHVLACVCGWVSV